MKKSLVFGLLFLSMFVFNTNYASATLPTIPTQTISFSRDLRIGVRGSDVKILQRFLRDQGYYSGKIDGIYGKKTARLIKEFQDDYDLAVTGVVDSTTLAKINEVANDKEPDQDVVDNTIPGIPTPTPGPKSNILVKLPQRGDVWMKDTVRNITWFDGGTTTCQIGDICTSSYDVKLVPYYAPCTSSICPMSPYQAPYTIATKVKATHFSWKVGTTIESFLVTAGNYTIQVCKTNSDFCGQSESFFEITNYTDTALSITTPSQLPYAKVGQYYTTNIEATGGADSYAWGEGQGKLPQGLVRGVAVCVTSPCKSPAVITGTPTVAGTYTFETVVYSGKLSTTKKFTLTVNGANDVSSIKIIAPNGGETLVQGLDNIISWSGGNCPQTNLTCVSISLHKVEGNTGRNIGWIDTGISNGNMKWDGKLVCDYLPSNYTQCSSYVPVAPGIYQIMVSDGVNSDVTDGPFTIKSTSTTSLSIITPSPLPNAKVGISYPLSYGSLSVSPSSISTNQLSWSIISGALPDKMYLMASDAGEVIYGTPDTSGTYYFTLQASTPTTPSSPTQITTKQFTLTVDPADIVPTVSSTASITVNGSEAPGPVVFGSSATVSWSSTNATSCDVYRGDGINYGTLVWSGTSGTRTATDIKSYTRFRIQCYPDGGSMSFDAASVDFIPIASPSATATILIENSHTPASVPSGTDVKVAWTSTGANFCQVHRGDGLNVGPIGTNPNGSAWEGTTGVVITKVTTYTRFRLTCQGDTGDSFDQASIDVTTVGFNNSGSRLSANALDSVTQNSLTNATTPVNQSFYFTQFLEQGSYGLEVRELQKVLTKAGYYTGNLDSIFGSKLKEAVVKFQTDNKLKADGIVGYEMRTFLNR